MADKKEYTKPEFIVVEPDEDGGARYRLPYGIAKGMGLDTTGMTPRQVWDMLKGHGVKPDNAYKELEKKAKTEIKKEEPKVVNLRLQRKTIREQVDTGYKGVIPSNKLDSYNKKALEYIIAETGMSEQNAKKFQQCLIEWFGGQYEEFTAGNRKKEEKIIDEGLMKMPTYNNLIYRGLHFQNGDKNWENFAQKQVGDIIKMKSISSWSSEISVAEQYAENINEYEDSVILFCEENKNGVACQNISKFGTAEAEVLCPSFSCWEISDKKVFNKYEYVKNYYTKLLNKENSDTEMTKSMLQELEERKNMYLKAKVCILHVKER